MLSVTQCPSSFHNSTPWRSMITHFHDCFENLKLHLILPLLFSYLWSMNTSFLFSLPLFVSTFLSVWSFISSPKLTQYCTLSHIPLSHLSLCLSLFPSDHSNSALIWPCVWPFFLIVLKFYLCCSRSERCLQYFFYTFLSKTKHQLGAREKLELNKRLSKHFS